MKKSDCLMAIILFFLSGLLIGLAIGFSRAGAEHKKWRQEIEQIRTEAEMGQQMERVLRIYTEEIKEALKIQNKGGDTE